MAIASAMDLEQLLTRIVESAVFITRAEEGSLLLLVLAGYAAIALENARLLEESERKFQTLATLHGAGALATGQPLGAEVAGILFGDEGSTMPQGLTPHYLATVIGPCLCAIADLQHLLDELAARPPGEVKVLAITQGWPVPVSLEGATEALQAIRQWVIPRGPQQAADRKDVAIAVALDLLSWHGPGFPDRVVIDHVTRLLPALETLLSCPLQISAV
jgi:hypothetical protein